MAQTSNAHAVATTPIGGVTVNVSGSSDIAIRVAPADVPELPKGLAVHGVLIFSVVLGSPITSKAPLALRAMADQDGDPESGQWLDSMMFGSAGGVLQLAIRDDEWLAANGISAEPVRYERQGMEQVINEAPAGTVLYVSAAWRTASTGTANDSSTWFAADLALPG